MNLRITLLLISIALLAPRPSLAEKEDSDVKAAFERCAEITREIAEIRQLDFTNKVEIKVQTKEDFIEYIEKEIGEQYGGPEDIESYVDALVLLGALKEKVEFTETLKEMMISQAAAHYDPRNDIYYLLMGDASPFLLDVISSHELCHALQDQHFDLTELIMSDPEAIRDNGDAVMAKQCIAEGDATIVMIWWAMTKQMPGTQRAQLSAQVSLGIGIQAAMDFDTMKQMMKQGVADSGMGFGSIAGSVEDLEKFPRYFMESLIMAYIQGAVAVDRVRTSGGWKAVNELYRNPPTSTEQILHPEKLIGERDEPVDVRIDGLTDTLPEGWKIAEEDVLGELGTRILFSAWNSDGSTNNVNAASAARGWDGDRYYYLKKGEEGALVWKSVWDSKDDAAKFSAALLRNLSARYPAAEQVSAKEDLRVLETTDRRLLLNRAGNEVVLVNVPKPISAADLLKAISN